MRHTAHNLDDIGALATRKIFEHVVDVETPERARRSLERRLSRGRLGRFEPMADFDWDWPIRIDRAAVESALYVNFVRDGRTSSSWPTKASARAMIAQSIAQQAVLAGHSVTFSFVISNTYI